MTGNNGWQGEPRPAFPFYAADWLASERIRSMTYAQRGAYIECLAVQWREGSLGDRVAIALRSGGMSDADVAVVLDAFPASEGGRRRNPRLERERRVLVERAKTASEAGRKGNQIRWRSGGDPNAIAKRRSSSSSSSVSSLSTEKRRSRPARLPVEDMVRGGPCDTPAFLDAWKAWEAFHGPYKTDGQLRRMIALGPLRAAAALRYSLAQEYDGIFEEKSGAGSYAKPKTGRAIDGAPKYPPRTPEEMYGLRGAGNGAL